MSEEERRQGFILYYLTGDWDRWVKRRIEQVELVTDSRVRRRISVDFRLHADVFGNPPLHWDDEAIHYVPLTMLEKAPFMHFDLRDESHSAVPLLRQRKSAALAAATLTAAAKVHVVRRLLLAQPGKDQWDLSDPPTVDAAAADEIEMPPELEETFLELCYLPFRRETYESGKSAAGIWENMLTRAANATAAGNVRRVSEWEWRKERGKWHSGQSATSWLASLLGDPRYTELAFDFARLFMICAPVRYDADRRRILKLQYEEHLSEPGLREVELVRQRFPAFSKWVREREDRAEGLNADHEIAQIEWIKPESTTNRWARRPTLVAKVLRGIGWQNKPFSFELPGMCLGGTFHFEFTAPEGTQLRRGRIQALPSDSPETGGHNDPDQKRRRFVRRYARNVSRCHLYLAAPPQGRWGSAVVALRPSPATIIRGAALSSVLTTLLILGAYVAGDDGLAKRPATIIALLLLAPGLIAAQLARPNEHPVTTDMLFGLRLLALAVAGVAVGAAALLGAQITREDACWPWLILVAASFLLDFVLLRAWRLAGRDWPGRNEV